MTWTLPSGLAATTDPLRKTTNAAPASAHRYRLGTRGAERSGAGSAGRLRTLLLPILDSSRFMRNSRPIAAAAAATFAGNASVSFAPGTAAATRTTATRAARSTAAGMASRPVTAVGAPSAANQPATKASAPAAMVGGTSGTATRFAAGAMTASRPKVSSAIGRVAAWAESETPRLSRSAPGIRGARAASQAVRGVAQATSPAVAAADSWNPTSVTVAGSTRIMTATAQPSPTMTRDPLPLSMAPRATPAITAARTTDGDAPAKTV